MRRTLDDHPVVERIRQELGEIEMDVLTSYTLADFVRDAHQHGAVQLRGGYLSDEGGCVMGAGFLSAFARGYIQ